MNEASLNEVISRLDTRSVEEGEAAWLNLKPNVEEALTLLPGAYRRFKSWQGRAALVYYATEFARSSEPAFALGCTALSDRSRVVRYRACGLLAYSQRSDAVPLLRVLQAHPDPSTVADAQAAIEAIEARNHHYFVDRSHSGRIYWRVTEADGPA